MTEKLTADIVVIGSGPGGAVTATLCAEAGKSVLMIEEGAHLPLESAAHFSRDEILQKYRNAGVEVAIGKTRIAYVEGRCVGGGSEINRGIYHRTPAAVLDDWRTRYDVHDLSLDSLTPHFDACEATALVEYLPGPAPLYSSRFGEGAERLGWSAIEAPRLFHYDAAAPPGRKQSMTETFVPRFLAAGGRLEADVSVRRISRTAGKWRLAAERSRGGETSPLEIIAEKVFVACGAVQTPALLRRSGLNRNIGNSLRFHPMLKIVAQFADEVNAPGDYDPVHQIKQFEPMFGMGCSISHRPMLGLALASIPGHEALVAREWKRMGLFYVQTSGGRAKVRNLPFFRDPLVTVRHEPAELAGFAQGLKRLAEALFAAGAVALYPAIAGYPVLRSPDDLRQLPEIFVAPDGSLTSVHVFASCPMGENSALSATNSFGKVHGADGLYIADASLLCGPTSVNPQGTVMAIAHRNAVEAIARGFR